MGSTVGELLGEAVGFGVGTPRKYVGTSVGSAVGALLGEAVGAGVGDAFLVNVMVRVPVLAVTTLFMVTFRPVNERTFVPLTIPSPETQYPGRI